MTINSQTVQDLIIGIGLIGGVLLYLKGHVPQQTIKNLEAANDSYVKLDATRQKSIEALEQKVKEVIDKHTAEKLEWTKAISDLQGQIKVYKELPLRELADGIAKVVEISKDNAKSNLEILGELKKTSIIAAEDRDVLTNQNLHIRTEVNKVIDSNR